MTKKTAKKKNKELTTETPSPVSTEVTCPVCDGDGLFYSGWGWADPPADNDCPRCSGVGRLEQSTLEAEETVACSECEGSGESESFSLMGSWDGDPEREPCLECKGTGRLLKSVVDAKNSREAWERRQSALPTSQERKLADYVSRVLSINLDQADRIVEMLIDAVNARRAHEDSWAEYDG